MRYYAVWVFGLAVGAIIPMYVVRDDMKELAQYREKKSLADYRHVLCDYELVQCLGYQVQVVEALDNLKESLAVQ